MSADPIRQQVQLYLKYVLGWHGDVPTRMILTAPNERQDFFLWRRSKLTNEVVLRSIDMFEQIEKSL